MLSESVSGRDTAKKEIRGSLLGLLVILGAVTILNTINPQITNTEIFRNADKTNSSGAGDGGSPINENASCPRGEVLMSCPGSTKFVGAKCSPPKETSWCDKTAKIQK